MLEMCERQAIPTIETRPTGRPILLMAKGTAISSPPIVLATRANAVSRTLRSSYLGISKSLYSPFVRYHVSFVSNLLELAAIKGCFSSSPDR